MFKPTEDRVVWDFWITKHDNKYHMHYLCDERREDAFLRHSNAKVGYAVSDDMVNWADHGIVFRPNPDQNAWDSRAIWTGSTIVLPTPIDGYKFAMLFTSHNILNPAFDQKVGLALSNDFINWHKYDGNPVIQPNPDFYHIQQPLDNGCTAWRDPKVIYDEQTKQFVSFITAERNDVNDWRAGAVARCTSDDLINWQVHEPVTDKIDTPQMEVPRILKYKNKYIMLVSASLGALQNKKDDWQQAVFIFIADQLHGHYKYSQTLYHTQTPTNMIPEPIYYTPEFIETFDGKIVMLGWYGVNSENHFVGQVSDPVPVEIDDNYQITLDPTHSVTKLINQYHV